MDTLERNRIITRATALGIVSNLAMAGLKLALGAFSGSVAVMSDAANNAMDVVSSLATLLGFELGKHKPTHEHPLGFGRVEYVTALFIAVLVLFTGGSFFRTSWEAIKNPEPVEASALTVALLVLTIAAKLALWRINVHCGRKADSEALVASGSDALSDVLATSVSLIGLVSTRFTTLPVDGACGILVSICILSTGTTSIVRTVSMIVGERPDKATVDRLRAIIEKHPPLHGGYDIQIHSYGPERKIGTVNVEVPSDALAEDVFNAMTDAQEEILSEMSIYMSFGMFAVNSSNPFVREMRSKVLSVLRKTSPDVMDIHAFHIHLEDSRVHFDLVVDFSLTDYQGFREKATEALQEALPGYTFKFNIEPDFA